MLFLFLKPGKLHQKESLLSSTHPRVTKFLLLSSFLVSKSLQPNHISHLGFLFDFIYIFKIQNISLCIHKIEVV